MMPYARRLIRLISALAALTTALLMVWAAQPWSTNPAYDRVSAYINLLIFIVWAASPYGYIFIACRCQAEQHYATIFRLCVCAIICIGGLWIVVDTMFFHIDAQGALVFVFLPLYQWLLLALAVALLRLAPRVIGAVRRD